MSEGRRVANESNKEKRMLNIPFTIIAVIFLIITIMFGMSIVKMNMLPNMYLAIMIALEVVITSLIIVGLAKNHKTYTLNIICLLIAIILSCGYIIGSKYINATTDFIGDVFTETAETEDYYVVARNNGEINKIEDLKNEKLYVFNVEEDVKKDIDSKVKVKYTTVDSLSKLGEDLLSKKEDAILISYSQYEMLSDEIKDFKTDTKVIYTATHKIKTNSEPIKEEKSKYSIKDEVFNVYISGIDTSGKISNVGRSDANIIATVNTKTHKVLLTSIPRDYYVKLHSKKALDKLTHSGIYGVNETISTVEDLLGIEINYYVRVNFNTVIKLVDVLGGVDVYSDYTFDGRGCHFNKGMNHINGHQALVFSRERYSFAGGDNQRVKNQQHVINAIIKKAMNPAILTKYTSILNSMQGTFQTNIDQKEISELVKMQLKDMPQWTIDNNALTGTGATKTTYSAGSQPLYVMIPNNTSVANAKDKINSVLNIK